MGIRPGVAPELTSCSTKANGMRGRLSFYNETGALEPDDGRGRVSATFAGRGFRPENERARSARLLRLSRNRSCILDCARHRKADAWHSMRELSRSAGGTLPRGAPMPSWRSSQQREMSDACGAAIARGREIALDGPRDIRNVRFQPYRLTNSKCYDSADARISARLPRSAS